jgi:hypothetical protein
MVGITNTGKTFPLAYCYITSESAKSFDFVAGELTKYVFYDCLEATVICADFTEGLGAVIAARALRESGVEDEAAQERICSQTSTLCYLVTTKMRTNLRLSSSLLNGMLQKLYKEG